MNEPKPDSSASLQTTELETLRQNAKAMESTLQQREEFYQSVLNSLAEGVLITNDESRIIYVNRQFEEVSGYTREELIGRVSFEVLSPRENWDKMRQRLKERLSGKVEHYEHELVRKDGSTTWISVQATPYRNVRGEIVGTVGAMSCIEALKSLEQQNEYLAEEIRSGHNFCQIVGDSPAIRAVIEQIQVVAPTQANVLILGESGTGKELVARAIHENSPRKGKPLVRVNCASVPRELFESEFFGHVRGAFTGAIKDRIGRFELAEGGTLFLDEVGEIPLEQQGKLLRVLQEGQFEKVGEDRTRTVNVRVIAATNRDLLEESRHGRFRQDLYYRLGVFPIDLPPLRERKQDIIPVAAHFLKLAAGRSNLPEPRLTKANLEELTAYDWPGNVRELQNVIERAVIIAHGGSLQFNLTGVTGRERKPTASNASRQLDTAGLNLTDLRRLEKEILSNALKETRGKLYGSDGAAKLLGIPPTTLVTKLNRHQLKPHAFYD